MDNARGSGRSSLADTSGPLWKNGGFECGQSGAFPAMQGTRHRKGRCVALCFMICSSVARGPCARESAPHPAQPRPHPQ